MARKHYSDEQVAHALAVLTSNGGNLLKTSRATGVERATLRAWQAGELRQHKPDVVNEKREGKEQAISDKLETFAHKAAERASGDEFVAELKGKDLLIAAGIAIEKVQLLRGRPTSRSESATIVYVQPTALRDMSGEVIEGTFRTDSGTKALAAGADV